MSDRSQLARAIRQWHEAPVPSHLIDEVLRSVATRRRRRKALRVALPGVTALVVAGGLIGLRSLASRADNSTSTIHVELRPHVPRSSRVTVIGDFNHWRRPGLALQRDPSSGQWSGRLLLPPGLHYYAYVVNDEVVVLDDGAMLAGDSLLGMTNAILVQDR